jgi:hypothetical protein
LPLCEIQFLSNPSLKVEEPTILAVSCPNYQANDLKYRWYSNDFKNFNSNILSPSQAQLKIKEYAFNNVNNRLLDVTIFVTITGKYNEFIETTIS